MQNALSFDTSSNQKNTQKSGSIFTDGGARGNPGPAACGVVLYDEHNKEIDRLGKYLDETTNNVAEYMGLLEGLQLATSHNITHLKVFMDSDLIVQQMQGHWKVKDAKLKLLHEQAHVLCEQFIDVEFQHVRREKNKVADSIVNEVLDRR